MSIRLQNIEESDMESNCIAATRKAAFAALLIAFVAHGEVGAAKAHPSTIRVNADECTTLVANAYYTGPYLGVDNRLPPSALARDLRCGAAFRNSSTAGSRRIRPWHSRPTTTPRS